MHTTERSSSGSYNCFVDFVGQSSRISENVFLFTIFLFIFIFSYYFKNECQGFIRFPKARKHLKQRLETWWNPKHEFLKLVLQQRKLVEIIILISFLNSNTSVIWDVECQDLSPTWFFLVCWHSMPRQCYLAICDFRKQTRCFAIQVAE